MKLYGAIQHLGLVFRRPCSPENEAKRLHLLIVLFWCLFFQPVLGWGQIGGQTSADGPFTLDNVEDVNTTASGVDRAWLSTFIYQHPDAFQAVPLASSGLTLAAGQTPIGALRYEMPTAPNAGYVDYSLGVPMPSVPGESTLDYPGNITTFANLTFLVQAPALIANQINQVILETYPGPDYPKLYWDFVIIPGNAFQRVTLDLRQPTSTLNVGNSSSISDLLSQTRFLSFYFYGGFEQVPKTLTVRLDDIQLIGDSAIRNWTLY